MADMSQIKLEDRQNIMKDFDGFAKKLLIQSTSDTIFQRRVEENTVTSSDNEQVSC